MSTSWGVAASLFWNLMPNVLAAGAWSVATLNFTPSATRSRIVAPRPRRGRGLGGGVPGEQAAAREVEDRRAGAERGLRLGRGVAEVAVRDRRGRRRGLEARVDPALERLDLAVGADDRLPERGVADHELPGRGRPQEVD